MSPSSVSESEEEEEAMEFRAAGVAAPPAEGAGDSQVRRRRPTPAPSPGAAAALSCSSLGDGGRSPLCRNDEAITTVDATSAANLTLLPGRVPLLFVSHLWAWAAPRRQPPLTTCHKREEAHHESAAARWKISIFSANKTLSGLACMVSNHHDLMPRRLMILDAQGSLASSHLTLP